MNKLFLHHYHLLFFICRLPLFDVHVHAKHKSHSKSSCVMSLFMQSCKTMVVYLQYNMSSQNTIWCDGNYEEKLLLKLRIWYKENHHIISGAWWKHISRLRWHCKMCMSVCVCVCALYWMQWFLLLNAFLHDREGHLTIIA